MGSGDLQTHFDDISPRQPKPSGSLQDDLAEALWTSPGNKSDSLGLQSGDPDG